MLAILLGRLQCPSPAPKPSEQPPKRPLDEAMPPKFCYVAEVMLGSIITIVAAAIKFLGDAAATTERQEALNWLLLPFLGALAAALCAFLLNPREEDRRTIGGRLIGGMFFGSVAPNLAFYLSETLQRASVIPAVPLTIGFCICALVYMLIKKFFNEGFKRADTVSEKIWDKIEDTTGLGDDEEG